jgi:hypothetical protein
VTAKSSETVCRNLPLSLRRGLPRDPLDLAPNACKSGVRQRESGGKRLDRRLCTALHKQYQQIIGRLLTMSKVPLSKNIHRTGSEVSTDAQYVMNGLWTLLSLDHL